MKIFDFMNVQSIHNATFANSLPAGYLEQARALANYHEYGVFSSPQLDGIGNSESSSLSSKARFSVRDSCWPHYFAVNL